MMADMKEPAGGMRRAGAAERVDLDQIIHHHPVNYRTPPAYLPTGSIIAEIVWIGDAVFWHGDIGCWARERRATLRAELRQREVGS